jgi:sec-independent protein translocase protein TatA
MFLSGIGYSEVALIALIAVVLFGSKLPEVARSVGQSYNQFRSGLNDIQSSIKTELDRELDDVKRIPQDIEASIAQQDEDEAGPSYDPPADI